MIELEADEAGFTVTWPRDGGEIESPAVERSPVRCSLGGPTTPTECDFEGIHSKIMAMCPEFPALRAITVSGSSPGYHIEFTHIFPFPYCYPTEEFAMTSQENNVRPALVRPEDFLQDL